MTWGIRYKLALNDVSLVPFLSVTQTITNVTGLFFLCARGRDKTTNQWQYNDVLKKKTDNQNERKSPKGKILVTSDRDDVDSRNESSFQDNNKPKMYTQECSTITTTTIHNRRRMMSNLTAENRRKRRQNDGRSEKHGKIHKIWNARRVETVVDVVDVGSSSDSRHVGRIFWHFGFECFKIEQMMKINIGLGERHRFQSFHDHGWWFRQRINAWLLLRMNK